MISGTSMSKRLCLVALMSICVLLATHRSSAQLKPLAYKEYDLPNGLHVILHEDHTAPVVATVVHYKVGSRDEDPARTGFAHFFEHLMFEGTEMIERHTIDKLISNAGGQLNAYTSIDETVYHFEVPSNQVRLPLWIEAQRMRKLNVNPIGVETQRGVVKEERKNRYDNVPYGGWFEKQQAILMKGTPYGWSPIGNAQHIDSASIDEFRAFYNRYYQPNNAILVVSGDFDEAMVRETITAYFGGYAKAPEPQRPNFLSGHPMNGEHRETINDLKAQLPAMFVGYRGISSTDEDSYAADLLDRILSEGESSRLYRACVDSLQVAVQAGANMRMNEYGGLTFLIGVAAPGKSLDDVEKAIDVEIRKLIDHGVSDAELTKAKNITEAEVVGGRTGMYNKALQLANTFRYFKNTNLINTQLEKYMKVTKQDIQRVAKRIFDTKNRVVLNYIPTRG